MRVPSNRSDVTFKVSTEEMLTVVAPFLPTSVTCATAAVTGSDADALSMGLIKAMPTGWLSNWSLVHPKAIPSTKHVHTMVCPRHNVQVWPELQCSGDPQTSIEHDGPWRAGGIDST